MVDPSGLEPIPWYQQFNLWHKLKAGDWCGSENGNVYDPNSFNRASIYNTVNKRSGEYKNIHYRQKYYSWAENRYKSKGHEVKWFSAANKVVKHLQTALLAGGAINAVNSQYGSNDRIDKFIKAGNKVILDDVIGRISDLEKSKTILKGNAARAWDAQTLSNEQAIMQPLYDTMLTEGDVNILNNNVKLNYGDNWDSKWDVTNPSHRWTLGMRAMGYKDAKPEDMPKPEKK